MMLVLSSVVECSVQKWLPGCVSHIFTLCLTGHLSGKIHQMEERKGLSDTWIDTYVFNWSIVYMHIYIYTHICIYVFIYTYICTYNKYNRVSLLFHWQKDFQASTMPTVYLQSFISRNKHFESYFVAWGFPHSGALWEKVSDLLLLFRNQSDQLYGFTCIFYMWSISTSQLMS